MANRLKYVFGGMTKLSDEKLYAYLDESFYTYIKYFTSYYQDSINPFYFEKLTFEEFQEAYSYVLDAALSSLNHPERDKYSKKLLDSVAPEFRTFNEVRLHPEYLPPSMPPKYVGWIQELLFNAFPIRTEVSTMNIDLLGYLISQAFIQGDPPRNLEQLTTFEEKLIVVLSSATLLGFEDAEKISNDIKHSHRHLAQITALTFILGIRFSVKNNFK